MLLRCPFPERKKERKREGKKERKKEGRGERSNTGFVTTSSIPAKKAPDLEISSVLAVRAIIGISIFLLLSSRVAERPKREKKKEKRKRKGRKEKERETV